MTATLHLGDCLDVMRTLDADSVDAVVTDPPAGISFMGKSWDNFGGRSNSNAQNDRDAANRGPGAGLGNQPFGYSGSALPKSKSERDAFIAFLAERLAEAHRVAKPGARLLCWAIPRTSHWTGTAIEDAGWIIEDRLAHLNGQGFPKAASKLKPAVEDWWLARKASKGVPPLNIDACRIATTDALGGGDQSATVKSKTDGWDRPWMRDTVAKAAHAARVNDNVLKAESLGRWPANLVLDEEAAAMLDAQTGVSKGSDRVRHNGDFKSVAKGAETARDSFGYSDSGGASRFYYCPKASKSDRGEGNIHPTVKSHNLMRWLVRLIAKPGDLLLDPFAGSGSTALACQAEGVRFVGVEQSAEYHATAEARIRAAEQAKAELLFA